MVLATKAPLSGGGSRSEEAAAGRSAIVLADSEEAAAGRSAIVCAGSFEDT